MYSKCPNLCGNVRIDLRAFWWTFGGLPVDLKNLVHRVKCLMDSKLVRRWTRWTYFGNLLLLAGGGSGGGRGSTTILYFTTRI